MTESVPNPSSPLADRVPREVLIRAKAGDLDAFEEILVCYEELVYRTGLRLLGQVHDAQDATQEVFIRLFKYLHRINEEKDLAPWIYRMTVNACRDIHRKRHRHQGLSLDDLKNENDLKRLTSSSNAMLEIQQNEQRALLFNGLRHLGEMERAAVVLRDMEGLTTKEVAVILQSSEPTVRSQICKARLKLKQFVERETNVKP